MLIDTLSSEIIEGNSLKDLMLRGWAQIKRNG